MTRQERNTYLREVSILTARIREAEEKRDYWQMSCEEASEIGAEARADASRLASLVEKLRQWVCCPRCGWMDGEPRNPAHQGCEDCEPLADLLTEMEKR